VVKSNELTDKQMQNIAKEMNLSETAFIINSDNADYQLRWFTPLMEVELCGHATIASLHYLKEINELQDNKKITFQTLSGVLKCYTENNWYYMQVPKYNMKIYTENRDNLLDTLGITESDTEKNFLLLDNGYLYVPINKLSVLGKLKPDFKALRNMSNSSPVQAVTVFTLDTLEKASSAHLRFFAPYYGIDEDPVTGSANGPLLSVLIETGKIDYKDCSELLFEQGDFVNRPGRVKVFRRDNEIYIAGKALTVLNGNIRV